MTHEQAKKIRQVGCSIIFLVLCLPFMAIGAILFIAILRSLFV